MRNKPPPPVPRPLPPPRSMEDFALRYHANLKLTGFGIGNVYTHAPCPFCAAPEFMVWETMEARAVMERGAQCRECSRSARVIPSGDGLMEFVQTGGPPQADWYEPQMRRLS